MASYLKQTDTLQFKVKVVKTKYCLDQTEIAAYCIKVYKIE